MSYHTRAACTYFRAGRCTKGELCPFSHAVEDKPQTCKWYKKMVGCRYGVSRRMPPPNTATAGCVGVVGSVAAAHALSLFFVLDALENGDSCAQDKCRYSHDGPGNIAPPELCTR